MLKMFNYMMNDSKFFKKYAVLCAFITCANILINWSSMFSLNLNGETVSPLYYILFFAGVFIMFVPFGYSIEVLRTAMENNVEFPNVNPKDNFLAGLNVVLAGSLLLIVLFIIFLLIGLINNFTANLFHGYLSNIFNAISILIAFIISFFGIAMCCNYVNNPSYFNFINFKDCANIINKNVNNYFKYYIVTIILIATTYFIIYSFADVFTKIGFIGLILYSFLCAAIWAYVTFILAYIFANATK